MGLGHHRQPAPTGNLKPPWVECGTRAVLAAAFGSESDGELTYAGRLLNVLDRTMLLLADAGFDGAEFARDVQATGAQFLVRSSARRIPTPFRHLGDGSTWPGSATASCPSC